MFSTKKRLNCLTYLMSLWLHVFKKITTTTGLNAEHCRLAVNETNHCHFMGWFPNAKNKPNWFPIANHDCKRRPLVDSMFFVKMKQRSRRRKNYRWAEIFNKLNNGMWKLYTGARATKQKYISIYIFLCMKTFLKMGVYIFIKNWTRYIGFLAFWLAQRS